MISSRIQVVVSYYTNEFVKSKLFSEKNDIIV